MAKVRLGEPPFRSIQGEGLTVGRNTVWIRFWGCDLSCRGFGQKDPTNPDSYEYPWAGIDFKTVKRLDELPVLDKGCDSAYSHEKEFMKLSSVYTIEELVDFIENLLKRQGGRFRDTDLCFTGGEPMMQQHNVVKILEELENRHNLPKMVTFETNGRWPMILDLVRFPVHYNLSISPKLHSVSGEVSGVRIDSIVNLIKTAHSQVYSISLKYVINGTKESWLEMEEINTILNQELEGTRYKLPTVYVMPVGGTGEQQESDETVRLIEQAIDLGYHVSPRVHNYIWRNSLGR